MPLTHDIGVRIPYPLRRKSARRCQMTPSFVLEHLCANLFAAVDALKQIGHSPLADFLCLGSRGERRGKALRSKLCLRSSQSPLQSKAIGTQPLFLSHHPNFHPKMFEDAPQVMFFLFVKDFLIIFAHKVCVKNITEYRLTLKYIML